jgi:hypothetical protein
LGLLNYLVREVLAIWDHLKTQMFGTKPPFDQLAVQTHATQAGDTTKDIQTDSEGSAS